MRLISRCLFLVVLISSAGSLCVTAQSRPESQPESQPDTKDFSEVFRQLLALPTRMSWSLEAQPPSLIERPPEFFLRENVPADNAPLEDLLMYWGRWVATNSEHKPSEAVRQRLLDYCAEDPESLTGYLALLSSTDAVTKRVKQLFDQGVSRSDLSEEWHNEVREWLLFNSKYFLEDLTNRANKAKDLQKSDSIKSEEAVVALAHVDWPSAEPLLKRLAESGQPRTASLAVSLIYAHAANDKDSSNEERYRTTLKRIGEDHGMPSRAREIAIDVLTDSDWSGRDDWYVSLFKDESLSDESNGVSPLFTPVQKNPDKWIPVLGKLIEGKDLKVRSAAAGCLIILTAGENRKDALKLLLPWLMDPDWAKASEYQRLRLIQSMGNVDLPESVPGLIAIVQHEQTESAQNRSAAGESLVRYKEPRAVPALKKALQTEKGEYHRGHYIKALIASGGISELEQIEGLEALAERRLTIDDRQEPMIYGDQHGEPWPVPVSIGFYLSRNEASESLIRAATAHADNLKQTNPPLATSLLEIIHGWQGQQVDLDLIHRIANGTADANTIATALSRGSNLREKLRPELQELVNAGGPAPGFGAVLLDDTDLAVSLLGSDKPNLQTAVVLAARISRMTLPAGPVIPLLKSQNEMLAAAAEQYLMLEDSQEAREALWAHHPNQVFITGWRERQEYAGVKSDALDNTEAKLRAEFSTEGSPIETYALLMPLDDSKLILRVFRDKAVFFVSKDSSRYKQRVITPEELATFKDFLQSKEIAQLKSQVGPCHHDCITSEFLQLNKERGRRVFVREPLGEWSDVIKNFTRLRTSDLVTHYNFEDEIKGLEILYRDDQQVVRDVSLKGSEARILVRKPNDVKKPEEQPPSSTDDDDEEDVDDSEAAFVEIRRKQRADEADSLSWRVLKNGQLAERGSTPDGYITLDETKFPLSDEELRFYNYRRAGQFISADSIIFSRGAAGLWRQSAGQKPVQISTEEGDYLRPVISPDGKWIVVAKLESDWRGPKYLVRFNLQTGRESRINLASADELEPLVYVAPHGKILVRRARREDALRGFKIAGPQRPEFYLLNPVTGEARVVTGEFAPLVQRGDRFLQPTGKPNEFWAAIPDSSKDQTRVGRYNLKDFTFQQVMLVPRISFDSMAMQVDEAAAKLYVVYKGELLRLPLATPKQN